MSIFSLSPFSLVTLLDATLMHLFCSIEHIGMADFPCLTGALDQKLILQVCWTPQSEKKAWKRRYMSIVRAKGLIKRQLDD